LNYANISLQDDPNTLLLSVYVIFFLTLTKK
jgi:hypothetical protein